MEGSDGTLCWPKAAKSWGIGCHQISHQNEEVTWLITDVPDMPKKFSGVAGTQQIDRDGSRFTVVCECMYRRQGKIMKTYILSALAQRWIRKF